MDPISGIDSLAKAEALVRAGQLEKLFLLPPEFGGTDDPRNIVYVPLGFGTIKANVDLNIIRPLVADGTVTEYRSTPAYAGSCVVPVTITIVASHPGSFTTTINIWGEPHKKGTL